MNLRAKNVDFLQIKTVMFVKNINTLGVCLGLNAHEYIM